MSTYTDGFLYRRKKRQEQHIWTLASLGVVTVGLLVFLGEASKPTQARKILLLDSVSRTATRLNPLGSANDPESTRRAAILSLAKYYAKSLLTFENGRQPKLSMLKHLSKGTGGKVDDLTTAISAVSSAHQSSARNTSFELREVRQLDQNLGEVDAYYEVTHTPATGEPFKEWWNLKLRIGFQAERTGSNKPPVAIELTAFAQAKNFKPRAERK